LILLEVIILTHIIRRVGKGFKASVMPGGIQDEAKLGKKLSIRLTVLVVLRSGFSERFLNSFRTYAVGGLPQGRAVASNPDWAGGES
jgi:hypothetical protein